jgi:hypothetical protein
MPDYGNYKIATFELARPLVHQVKLVEAPCAPEVIPRKDCQQNPGTGKCVGEALRPIGAWLDTFIDKNSGLSAKFLAKIGIEQAA